MNFYLQQSDHLCDKLMHQSVTEVTETLVAKLDDERKTHETVQLSDTNADRWLLRVHTSRSSSDIYSWQFTGSRAARGWDLTCTICAPREMLHSRVASRPDPPDWGKNCLPSISIPFVPPRRTAGYHLEASGQSLMSLRGGNEQIQLGSLTIQYQTP